MESSKFSIKLGLIVTVIGFALSALLFIYKPNTTYWFLMLISSIFTLSRVIYTHIRRKQRLAAAQPAFRAEQA